MRAAPGRAVTAPRLIARMSRRVGIAVLVRPISSRSKVNSALNPYGTAHLVTEEPPGAQVACWSASANAPPPLLFEGRRVRPSRFPVPLGNGAPGRRLGSVRYALPLAPLAIGMPRVWRGHARPGEGRCASPALHRRMAPPEGAAWQADYDLNPISGEESTSDKADVERPSTRAQSVANDPERSLAA